MRSTPYIRVPADAQQLRCACCWAPLNPVVDRIEVSGQVSVSAVYSTCVYIHRDTAICSPPKNVAENIPAHVLRKIRKEIEDG
jgi:hypothetical protein